MVSSVCAECLQEKPLVKVGDKELCKYCTLNNRTNRILENLFKKEEIKKEIVAKYSKCLGPVYNVDPPRKFHKSFGFEHIFSSSEVEEIILCKVCSQKKLATQRIKNLILFLCLITLLYLWIRLFHWETISKLWSEHPKELALFTVTIIFLFITFSLFESIMLMLSKTKKRIKRIWKYTKHYFTKKEVLSFQIQEDENFSWSFEMYTDKKVGFCSMCQGEEILNRDKIKKMLYLTLKVLKIKSGNKKAEENIVNSFCRGCSKKKIEDLRNNPNLKNPERLKKLDRDLN